MHCACAFAAEVRYRARLFKTYGYKVSRNKKTNYLNSPSLTVSLESQVSICRSDIEYGSGMILDSCVVVHFSFFPTNRIVPSILTE